jgi:hypothetical protein
MRSDRDEVLPPVLGFALRLTHRLEPFVVQELVPQLAVERFVECEWLGLSSGEAINWLAAARIVAPEKPLLA